MSTAAIGPCSSRCERARPRGRSKVDNGPEFASRMPDQWAHPNGVGIEFSRRGKPADNAHIKALNGRLRAKVPSRSGLNGGCFCSALKGWNR